MSLEALTHVHWYSVVEDTGQWWYCQCRCGKRKIKGPMMTGGYQPVDRLWVKTGRFTRPTAPPPKARAR